MPPKTNWLSLFPDAEKCNADYFIDGEEYFGELIKAFSSAKNSNHYIYILGWMLDLDFSFRVQGMSRYQSFSKSLSEAAVRGVEIRILVWNNVLYIDSIKKYSEGKHPLQKHENVKIYTVYNEYSPLKTKELIKGFSDVVRDFSTNKPLTKLILKKWKGVVIQRYIEWTKNSSFSASAHHEKIVVVNGSDGLIGYCGGFDLNKNRIRTNNKPSKLHDVACKVNGGVAVKLLEQFLQRWRDYPEKDDKQLRGESLSPKTLKIKEEQKIIKVKRNLIDVQKVGTYNASSKTDRSLKHAYSTIIKNAKKFIYIEGQYTTNIDIARLINKKLKNNEFELVFIATQDSSETMGDTLMPGELRSRFLDALHEGLVKDQGNKVLFTVINKGKKAYQRETYHHAQHSKVLIADDEVAIVGSANANQRSFSIDSETSLVLIDSDMVKKMRTDLWYHTVLNKSDDQRTKKLIENHLNFLPQAIRWQRKSRIKSYLRLYNYYPDEPDLNIQYKDSALLDVLITNSVIIKQVIFILLKNGFLENTNDKSLISPPVMMKSSPGSLRNLRKRIEKLQKEGRLIEIQAEYAAVNMALSPSQRQDHLRVIFLYLIEHIFDLRS